MFGWIPGQFTLKNGIKFIYNLSITQLEAEEDGRSELMALLPQPQLIVCPFVDELLPAPIQVNFLGRVPIKMAKLHH